MNTLEHVKIVRSTRAKRLGLRLDSKERVIRLTVPQRCSERYAQKFLDKNLGWIEKQITNLPAQITLYDGVVIPLFGQDHIIRIHLDDTRKTTRCLMEDGVLHVTTNQKNPGSRIIRFLKKQAEADFTPRLQDKAAHIKKSIKSVRIGDMKSRWGSCSSDGKISLSWRLIFAPPEACDYVIAHEVAHLKRMDHSQKFWDICEELCDDYETGKKWMRSNGHTLMAYGD